LDNRHGAQIVAGPGGQSKENHHANARLIAAAPDLLEAAKAALVWLYNTADGFHEGCPPKLRDLCAQLHVAIAKAEGTNK
jgi:hypothetical protein